jgi:glutathione S-transferase
MSQLILHHFASSPFAEKVRMMLGFKGLAWTSVQIPNIMPKPDLVALTGGYRRTPVMQIGADIYCDTALIADLLEQLEPEPTLYPRSVEAASRTLAQWADATLFWTAIPYTMQPEGLAVMFKGVTPEQMKAFAEDRNALRNNAPRMRIPEARLNFEIYLGRLEAMLGEQAFFFGDEPSIADFSIAHCLWFVTRGGPVAEILKPHQKLVTWFDRMRTFEHAPAQDIPSGAALDIAQASTPLASKGLEVDVHGFGLGEKVQVAATDYGTDPIFGTLYSATRDAFAIRREDPRAGVVVVHFPRLGFEVRVAK